MTPKSVSQLPAFPTISADTWEEGQLGALLKMILSKVVRPPTEVFGL